MADVMVQKTQEWLNNKYGGNQVIYRLICLRKPVS